MNNLVIDWFGESFIELDPLLQDLHHHGGELSGEVDLEFGSGLAGLIGHRLAIKLGLPSNAGNKELKVSILQQDGALLWARQFDSQHNMISKFVPYGHYPEGYWREATGKLALDLGVKISEGGWYWVQRKIMFMGVPLPLWLFPSSHAYKRIKNSMYEFSVMFSLPFIGKLVSYNGTLTLKTKSESQAIYDNLE